MQKNDGFRHMEQIVQRCTKRVRICFFPPITILQAPWAEGICILGMFRPFWITDFQILGSPYVVSWITRLPDGVGVSNGGREAGSGTDAWAGERMNGRQMSGRADKWRFAVPDVDLY